MEIKMQELSFEQTEELYRFLTGIKVPDNQKFQSPKLSFYNAFEIIYYMQEHLEVVSNSIEKCNDCEELFDSNKSGYYLEDLGEHFCDECFPNISKERKMNYFTNQLGMTKEEIQEFLE